MVLAGTLLAVKQTESHDTRCEFIASTINFACFIWLEASGLLGLEIRQSVCTVVGSKCLKFGEILAGNLGDITLQTFRKTYGSPCIL
jgi:hypothetical protein